MARIRSIHPGLLTDEAFMTLTLEHPRAVVLLLGLLMESDDHGVFEWKPLTLKARTLPAVPDDVGKLLEVLAAHRFIMSYEIDGRKLGAVRNFCKFQRPKKPNPVFPKTDEVRKWIALKPDEFPTSSPPDDDEAPQSSRISPQMEDGGWRMEGEKETEAAAAASLRAARGDFEDRCRQAAKGEPCAEKASFKPVEAWLDKGCPESVILAAIDAAIRKASTTAGGFRSWGSFDGWIESEWRTAGGRSAKSSRPLSPDEMARAAAKKAELVARGVLAA